MNFSLLSGIIDPNEIINKIIPNFWMFLVQLISFLVLVFIVIKFAYKPVNNYITKRQEYMQNELLSAKEKNYEANKKIDESNSTLNAARSEASQIIEKAKEDAKLTKEEILLSAEKEVDIKRKQLQQEIELEKKQAKDDIKNQIIDVALLASEEVLKRNINDDDHKKLLNDFVEELDK